MRYASERLAMWRAIRRVVVAAERVLRILDLSPAHVSEARALRRQLKAVVRGMPAELGQRRLPERVRVVWIHTRVLRQLMSVHRLRRLLIDDDADLRLLVAREMFPPAAHTYNKLVVEWERAAPKIDRVAGLYQSEDAIQRLQG